MARQKTDASDDEMPVLHTPRGAAPRGLRSDAFEAVFHPPAVVTPPVATPPPTPVNGEPLDWAFAMPDAQPQDTREPLIDPDANWRHQAALRMLPETTLPERAREKFSENWERLASEPSNPPGGSPLRRRMERSRMGGWLFSHGRLDLGAAFGPLLLVLLLAAAIIYGRKLLSGGSAEPSRPPAAEVKPAASSK